MSILPTVFPNFSEAIYVCGKNLRQLGNLVAAKQWQSTTAPAPMLEILEPSFRCRIHPTLDQLREDIRPNVEWADMHFEERVGGLPTNPGEAYKYWPYFQGNKRDEQFRHVEEKFTHTYQERIWPKLAPHDPDDEENQMNFGIRYRYGDLNDVVNLLKNDILTRQAFLPIWFPEDTGVVHGGRVPCTLGYLFMQRHGFMHCTYYIRSCDYMRHFRDDIYLACRLLLWMIDQVDATIAPGFLNMHIGSLHCFNNEKGILPK